MCGIIITKDLDRIPLLKHRGIESHYEQGFGFYFGHHRLPIQTVEGDGLEQPLKLKDGGLLLFNGEIFNIPMKYTSDVEYLLDLFNSENIRDILEEANNWDGFWSIVHVTPNGFMYCFTDPLGKKQLYYNERGEICSEIRPLVRNQAFDELYKSSVYKWGYNTDDRTPWEGVRRIMPNRLYVFVSGRILNVDPYPYFDWTKNQSEEDLRTLLYRAVERRLISKTYQVGTLVSGGLDSSIIARILNDLGSTNTFYSVENNEALYANLLAQFLGIDLTYLTYDIDQEMAESFLWNETPVDLGSVIPQHKLLGVVPEKIVLTGDGADELFGGYRRIKTYDSQKSDVFEELPFYHLPRLDRASMRYTIELRNPFLSHDVVKYALSLPYSERIEKKHLKDTFRGLLPDEILDREKVPLKNDQLRQTPEAYKSKGFDLFYNQILKK